MRYTPLMGCWTSFEPLPKLTVHLAATNRGLFRLSLGTSAKEFIAALPVEMEWRHGDHPMLRHAIHQLQWYFQGRLRKFELPLDLRGTEFQQRVWRALREIPYGETRTYADVARAIGSPRATRAVGQANGANPVAIIVPCHRVIASNGGLGGYGAGLGYKKTLLTLEAVPARDK